MIATCTPAVRLRWVRGLVVMKGVKQARVHQIARPYHGCWPYQKSSRQPGKAVAGTERGDAK